jgi:hypothetical protein
MIEMKTRGGFVKTIAAGGAADGSALLPRVSTETSDGKSKYGRWLVKLPIRKMGEASMVSA